MNHADLMRRLKNDLADIYSDRDMEGIYVCPDDEDTMKVHALVIGPDGTPYEKGFFYFIFNYPESYPLQPPAVKLMTTGNGTVRFNPNLYNCGKVCLSILGTWTGPGWTSVMTTKSVLISIQSLMNEKPFFNEPGYEKKEKSYESESRAYNERVAHDTLRVAVIDMVSNALDLPAGDGTSNGTASGGATATASSTVTTDATSVNGAAATTTTTKESTVQLGTTGKAVKIPKLGPRRPYRVVPFQMPHVLKEMVIRLFHKWYGHYLSLAEKNSKRDGQSSSDGHRQSLFLEKGYKFEYNNLKTRLEQVYKRIRMEENLAVELYDSLRSNYCPTKTVSLEEEEEMTALFNENE